MLVPWWSKLVRRVLEAEHELESESVDERKHFGVASDATRIRLCPAVDDDAGHRARRVEAATVRAR